MSKQKPTSYSDEDLHFKNELSRLRLRAELGMQLGAEPSMSLEREREWLQHVEAIEKEDASGPKSTVFNILGEPEDITPLKSIARQDFGLELAHVRSLLQAHNMEVYSICPIDDREMYRFILEEIFTQEIPVPKEQGIFRRFIYEDFYPNPEHEIKETVKGFFHKTFEGSWKLLEGKLAPKVQSVKPTAVNREVMMKRLKTWVSLYQDIFLAQVEFLKIEVNEGKAVAAVSAHYEGAWAANGELASGDVLANFQFIRLEEGYWLISGMFISGIQ